MISRLPRYLVSIDVFKATAIVIVLALHTLRVSGLKTERNGALQGFQMMSGLFYELSGLGTARSVCRALSEGQPKRSVLSRLLRRALIIMGASVLLRVLTIMATQYMVEPLLEDSDERAARWARWHFGELLQRGVFDLRALTFHGACQLLAAPMLLSVVRAPGCDGEAEGRQRVASGCSAMALLGCALLVLTLTPWLRSLADAATCCVPDHAALGYSGKCDQDASAIISKPTKPGAAYPLMRVPDSCLRVVGDGSAPSTFDPCNFTAVGPPYIPPCAEGEALPDWEPCQRAAELSKEGGARSRRLCEIYPSAARAANSPREARSARKRCLVKLQALSTRLETTSLEGGEYARALQEELDSVSLGTIWCPLVVSVSNATEAPEGLQPSRAVVATIQGARPYWRSRVQLRLSKEDITHVVASPRRIVITWALTVLFGLHGVFAYLTPTLVGMALGVALEAEGGVTSRLLAAGSVGCIGAFTLGLWLISTASFDGLLDRLLLRLSAGHTRLFFGAMDTAIVLLVLRAIESVPTRREALEANTVAFRRFARLSFSLYTMQEVTTRLLWLLLIGLLRTLQSQLPAVLGRGWAALTFKRGEAVDLASCKDDIACLHAHAMLCLCLVFATVAFHSVLLARWERIGFAGSFEAWATRRLGKRSDEAQDKVAAGPVEISVKWPVVFASVALITWSPALSWSLVSSLMLPPYHEVDAATEAVRAANAIIEEELTGWLLLCTLAVPLALAAASLAEHKHAAGWLHLPRHLLFSGVLFLWAAYRSVHTAGSLWLALPAVGLLRADLGAVGLGLACAVVAWAPRRVFQLSTLLALLVAGFGTPPRYLTRQPIVVASNASVDVYDGVLSIATCEAIEQAAWKQQALWTKVTESGALPYFSFGWIANFDGNDAGTRGVPLWSWRHGLRPLLGHESANALLPAWRARRAAIQDELLKLATPLEPLRDAIAKQVGVAASQVVFGGEDAAIGMGFPGIQIYLPNALWQVIVNPHTDDMFSQQYGLGADPTCVNTTLTTFLVPVVAPEGAGLLFWNASGEHEVEYKVGSLYAFDAQLLHSIRPWHEWRAMQSRMTVQAFAMQCGDMWFVYH